MKIVVNPDFNQLTSFIESVPALFDTRGELIYEGRNQLKVYDTEGYTVVVKSFKKPYLINRLAYTFFRPSKAMRSYEHALELLKRGVDTPAPIAYIEEKKDGLLNRSYYVSTFRKDYDHIRLFMNGTKQGDDDLLTGLARFIALLHEKGVYFLDLSPGNVLWKKENGHYLFSLIDINRMEFKSAAISLKDRYKNFERLSYKNEVITSLARKYADVCGLDEEKSVTEIKKACEKFFMAKYRRSIQ